ncbi:MAG: hypothetical protein K9G62_06735 [Alphaproteobacteria bacterium]|nr:hypothetical protein [Alphaproteobacteria bacterium]
MRFLFLALFLAMSVMFPARAQEVEKADPFRSTDYPLPRFVSLAKDEVNVRTGPGTKFPLKWSFKKRELPVEIILEYGPWRKIRDREGQVGWVHESMLSGRRTALIEGSEPVPLHARQEVASRLLAYLEPGVIAALKECAPDWCRVESAGYKGWMERKFIWGVYESENFD